MDVLSADTADASSVTVPGTESAAIKTYTPRENAYPYLMARAIVSIASTGTSSAQAVTFRIKVGGTTKSYVFTTKAAVDNDYLVLEHVARHNSKTAIDVTVQGAGADANTTVLVKELLVFGLNSAP